jgi:hypothetical protein
MAFYRYLEVRDDDDGIFNIPPGSIFVKQTPIGDLLLLIPVTDLPGPGPQPVTVHEDGTITGHIGVKDKRPHSRACGIRPHDHGPECHGNCPTCHGSLIDDGSAPTVPIESLDP